MTYTVPGYTVQELFDVCDITTVSLSAMRYALRTKTIIWVL